MDSRPILQERLQKIAGNMKVYFDPPSVMEYPCIKYELSRRNADYADGQKYIRNDSYVVTIIDRSHSHGIKTCDALEEEFPTCVFDRPFTSEGLHHFVYTVKI